MGKVTAPELLNSDQELSGFNCGNETLNEWLLKRAIKNQNSGASKTYVVCDENKVVAYYALASGSVERIIAPSSISRSMPDPIPVVILGRLAVDVEYQGLRLATSLLKESMLRTLSISQTIGVRALLVHAISDDAKSFYLNYGFQESPIDPMILFLSIKKLKSYFI